MRTYTVTTDELIAGRLAKLDHSLRRPIQSFSADADADTDGYPYPLGSAVHHLTAMSQEP